MCKEDKKQVHQRSLLVCFHGACKITRCRHVTNPLQIAMCSMKSTKNLQSPSADLSRLSLSRSRLAIFQECAISRDVSRYKSHAQNAILKAYSSNLLKTFYLVLISLSDCKKNKLFRKVLQEKHDQAGNPFYCFLLISHNSSCLARRETSRQMPPGKLAFTTELYKIKDFTHGKFQQNSKGC